MAPFLSGSVSHPSSSFEAGRCRSFLNISRGPAARRRHPSSLHRGPFYRYQRAAFSNQEAPTSALVAASPSISFRKPNPLVLEAQARVCTGPTQTRPLDESKAFEVLKTIVQSGQLPVAGVRSLTHYGEPYDGNTRFFRSTLFVAAVRASYGEACLLHGAESMPPKMGVTEEQMLKHMGAFTALHPVGAAKLLEDEKVGFAYVSQREARPALHSIVHVREHIKKRPPIATTEKVQRYVRGTGPEAMIAGFYHEGYKDPLLMLMRRRGATAGLVVKGEEGALSLTTKEPLVGTAVKGFSLNFCAGFRPSNQHVVLSSSDDPEKCRPWLGCSKRREGPSL